MELWRRTDEIHPPGRERLKDSFNRATPYFRTEIETKLREGKNVLVVAHGKNLRALLMYLKIISPQDITKLNIPTGSPQNYVFDEDIKLLRVN